METKTFQMKDYGEKKLDKIVIKAKDTNIISDTFGELYKHRIHLFIALCKYYIKNKDENWFGHYITKSKKHYDGTSFDGWFIVQMDTEHGQISYHLPNKYWNKCDFIETIDKGEKWDGHTSDDVLERLLKI